MSYQCHQLLSIHDIDLEQMNVEDIHCKIKSRGIRGGHHHM